jgi:hypothetical protein
MRVRATQAERRVHFYATVMAYAEREGVSVREAFRRMNDTHVTLSGTFSSIGAFEMWVSRHREQLLGLRADSGAIPTIFEDANAQWEGGVADERTRRENDPEFRALITKTLREKPDGAVQMDGFDAAERDRFIRDSREGLIVAVRRREFSAIDRLLGVIYDLTCAKKGGGERE